MMLRGASSAEVHGFDLRSAGLLGLLLGFFILLQCFLPLRTALKIGADEDFEPSKVRLCEHGYRLYSEIWCDQPPLYVSLLAAIDRHTSSGIFGLRLLTSAAALLLLASVFALVLRKDGLPAAAVATGMLIASPGFLELSASVMQEIPALAPVVAALCVLRYAPRSRLRLGELLAGVLFATALQIKLIGIVYAPLVVLILWLRRSLAQVPNSRGNGSTGDTRTRLRFLAADLGAFALAAGGGFVLINSLTGNPLLIQIQQAWGAHFAFAKSSEYGSSAEHAFDWLLPLKNWDATTPALIGTVLLATWARFGSWRLLPLAWLALSLAAFGTHKPWWAFYYVHNAIPICWCAAVCVVAAWNWLRARPRGILALCLGLYALGALAWMGARVYLQASAMRRLPRIYTCLVLKQIERFKPFTEFFFTDQPIYSYYCDIPRPRIWVSCR